MSERASARRFEELALWGALLLAFSPAALSLLAHWFAEDWARYSMCFLLLLVLGVRAEPKRTGSLWLGCLLIVGALLVQSAALLVAFAQASRGAFVVAIIGLLLLRGSAPLRAALLAMWIVPVPSFVSQSSTALAIDLGLFDLASGILAPLGWEQSASSSAVDPNPLDPRNGIVPLFAHASGLAWYLALRLRMSWARSAGVIAAALSAAVPIQVLTLASALWLLTAAQPIWMVELFQALRWLVPFVVVVAYTERTAAPAD